MAKIDISGFESIEAQIGRLERISIKRIVEAGAKACAAGLAEAAEAHGHVRTGQMRDSFAPGEYREDFGGGSIVVSPKGTDRRGTANAKKAFVINFGRGGKRTKKTGDKFITGAETKRLLEEKVQSAMKAEAETIFREAEGG